ncbi:MAG: twin transmembrane helix small protein [Sulfuricella sp.]|nr:twin transmembrane helix small protein [Sulfuricella sp.]
MFKIVVILLLALVVGSLFSALIFLARDQGRGERTARALTLRIALSLLLFAVLMAGFYFGFIQPFA